MKHQSLIHKMINTSTLKICRISDTSSLFRHFSSAYVRKPSSENHNKVDKDSLYKMLSTVNSKNKVSNVLYRLSKEGKQFEKKDLVSSVKTLRKSGRYHHCLQILDWVEKGTTQRTERDSALRLGIIYNLKGIDEAEKFFDGLPSVIKCNSTYGALLNCYCAEKMTDKASTLFEKMDVMNYSNDLAYKNLMGLFMKVDQPEKVAHLVQEMKKKNVPLSSHSYSIWIQSYGCLNDLEGVERVMDEVQQQNDVKNDWVIYSNLASVYIKVNQPEKAEEALKKLEEVLDNMHYPIREAYHYLISFCASTDNLGVLTRVWEKFKSKLKVCNNHDYLIMLNALSKLDDIEGLKKCFKEWESINQSHDARLPAVVIGAYLKWDMVEEAELLLKDATDRLGHKIWNSHVLFAIYYLSKRQTGSAMKHMELVIVHKGKQFIDGVKSFFEYFEEEKDVDSAEEFFQMLKKARRSNSDVYLWLLQTYVAAGKKTSDLRQRMETDGVDIGAEHKELLEKVSTDLS